MKRVRFLVISVAAVIAMGALSAVPVQAAAQTPYNVQLIENPGAEAGPASHRGPVSSVPNWYPDAHGTVVRYGSTGFPTTSESARIKGGRKFFSCGPGVPDRTLFQQDQILKGRHAAIAGGHVKVVATAWIATYDSQADWGNIVVSFGQGNSLVDAVQSPSVTASNGVFHKVKVSSILPTYTEFLVMNLVGNRVDGMYCDAYFDNVRMKIVYVP